MAEDLYIGSTRGGRRIHLVGVGVQHRLSNCGRTMSRVVPVAEARPAVDADWCRTCIREAERSMVLAGGLARNDRYGVPRFAGLAAQTDGTWMAWAHVADGYEAALTVSGLSDEDQAHLLRQLRCAQELAGRGAAARDDRAVTTPPQRRTQRDLYSRAIEVNRELAEALDPDDLLRLSCRALASALERRSGGGDA